MADKHYKEFKLKRVYFSGYIPINTENNYLPAVGSAPPLLRENRLYQSDWLMRFTVLKLMKLSMKTPKLRPWCRPEIKLGFKASWKVSSRFKSCRLSNDFACAGHWGEIGQENCTGSSFWKNPYRFIKKLGVAYQRAKFFIRCEDSPKFQKELSSSFIRQQILTQGSSKYVQQLSPQLSLGF